MKRFISACLLILGASAGLAGEAILPYSAFGPQVAAYELIGMEWWQWDSHGDDTAHDYPIKVVVFWNQTKEETAKRHPVDQAKQQDFRYVEYSKAIAHMKKIIKDFKGAELDATSIERALADLERKHRAEAVPPNRSESPSLNPESSARGSED
jgi:hypothetical protein